MSDFKVHGNTWGIIKYTLITLSVISIISYCAVFFLAPYFLNKKDFSLMVTKSLEKTTGLVVLIDGHNLSLSPRLDIKLKTDNISVFYPNKKQFLDINQAEVEISPISLLKKEVFIRSIKADNLQFSTKLLKSGKTTLQVYLEEHLKSINNKDFKISETIPTIEISKYLIKLKDERSTKRLKIDGRNFCISQNPDFRYFTLNTDGDVYISGEKRIKYTSKLEIPRDITDFKDFSPKISLDDIFKQKYTADLDINLKLFSQNSKFDYANGTIYVDNFIFYLSDKALPKSHFHIKTAKGKAEINSEFYTNQNEITDIKAFVRLKKPYSANVKFDCPKADIANLQKLATSVMDLLSIKNEIADFKASGTLKADFSVMWNENELQSDGKLKISNASLIHKTIPFKITSANAFIDFSNNNLEIIQSTALVNNQPIKAIGHVSSDATGKLSIKAENLDLNNILKAFPFIKLNNDIVLSSGKLSFNADVSGKLTQSSPIINAVVTNISGKIKSVKTNFDASKIKISTKIFNNKPSGEVTITGLSVKSNQSTTPVSLTSDKISAVFDEKNLKIQQSRLSTGNANLTLSGDIKNYQQKPDVNLCLKGTVDTTFLKSLTPQKIHLSNKGYLPIKLVVSSLPMSNNSFDVDLKVLANTNNYITPVHIKNIYNQNSLTHIQAILNQNDINIKDMTMYYAQNINNLNNNINLSGLKKLLSVKGKIKNINNNNSNIDNLRLITFEPLNIEIKDSIHINATVSTDIVLNCSTCSNMNANGVISIDNISLPQYNLAVNSTVLNLKNRLLQAKANNIKIDNTSISMDMSTYLPNDLTKFNKINNLNISADSIDMEKITQFLQKMFQAKYAPGADIPIDIVSGKLNIKNFKMDILNAQNITADFTQKNNVVNLKNLSAYAYGGKIAGTIEYNLSYASIKAVLQGRGLNAESATTALMPKEQRLSGMLDFDADLNTYGNTMEQQMKTLSGRADLLVKNGYFAQLGRFEHFLYAQNLLSQKLIFASLNSAIQAISPKDTGRFTYLKGMAKFSKGFVHLNPVTTSGPQMSMYITGRINMLNNEADLKVLGKVSSEVSSSLGILGKMTIKDFVDEHTSYGQTLTDLFNFYNSELPEVDITKIPPLNPDLKYQTKNFQVLLYGNMSSVKSVKSFTWVNPIGTKRKSISTQPNTQTELPNNNNNNKETQKESTNSPSPTNTPDFLDNIPDNFN